MYQNLVNSVTIKIELEMLALAMFLKKNNLSRMRLVRKHRVLFMLAVVPDLVQGQVFDMLIDIDWSNKIDSCSCPVIIFTGVQTETGLTS